MTYLLARTDQDANDSEQDYSISTASKLRYCSLALQCINIVQVSHVSMMDKELSQTFAHSVPLWPLNEAFLMKTRSILYINTVWCRYNAVKFLTTIHKKHPIARPSR